MSNIAIAPSILSADFCNLERDLKAIANADLVHVDVMDHHFVPNLTLGEPIVGRICQVTDLPVDVHLMIEDPDRWAPEYAKLGAASISFHMVPPTPPCVWPDSCARWLQGLLRRASGRTGRADLRYPRRVRHGPHHDR